MAVVSEIPTEVLTEIFCKSPICVWELNNLKCKEDFPWAVGLVSRRWRTAFLSYTPIWSSLTLSDWEHQSLRMLHLKICTESYTKEVNKRLALYLERSGGHPLRLDISLLSTDHNFIMMVLEMLSACSHRWRTANLDLFHDWPLDSMLPCKGNLPTLEWLEIRHRVHHKHVMDIFEVAPRLTHAYIGPWTKSSGWILPWTQLTELNIILDGDSAIENDDVPYLLSMLHNIRELRFRLRRYIEIELPSLKFSQFTPTLLNQLRVLEVYHPIMLSWFEAPSLCELYFTDYKRRYSRLLDLHGPISSLIQRSSCKIRKLSLDAGRDLRVGTLKDVEELVIDYQRFGVICPPISISSLPKLRLLTIHCSQNENGWSLVSSLTTVLESTRVPTRSERLSGSPASLLERVTVELHYDYGQLAQLLLEVAKKWPVEVVFRTRHS